MFFITFEHSVCQVLTNWTCHTSAGDTRHSFHTQWVLELCLMKCVDVVKSSLEGSDSLCRKLRVWEVLHLSPAASAVSAFGNNGQLERSLPNLLRPVCSACLCQPLSLYRVIPRWTCCRACKDTYLNWSTHAIKLDTVKLLCELFYSCVTVVLNCLNNWLNLPCKPNVCQERACTEGSNKSDALTVCKMDSKSIRGRAITLCSSSAFKS